MVEYFDSGQVRTLLRSAAEDNRKLRQPDEMLVNQAKKHQKDSGKILDQQAGKLADISRAIDDIVSGEDDGIASS